MKSTKALPTALAVALLAMATAASAQPPMERRAAEAAIAVDAVTPQSPAVRLAEVGKEVAPGVFAVDPAALRGRRLVLPPGGGTARFICIGKWDAATKTCKGIYIEW